MAVPTERDQEYLEKRLASAADQLNTVVDRIRTGEVSIHRWGAAWQHIGEIIGYRQALGLREADLPEDFVDQFRAVMAALNETGKRLDHFIER